MCPLCVDTSNDIICTDNAHYSRPCGTACGDDGYAFWLRWHCIHDFSTVGYFTTCYRTCIVSGDCLCIGTIYSSINRKPRLRVRVHVS
jgi:hypothetical protein